MALEGGAGSYLWVAPCKFVGCNFNAARDSDEDADTGRDELKKPEHVGLRRCYQHQIHPAHQPVDHSVPATCHRHLAKCERGRIVPRPAK